VSDYAQADYIVSETEEYLKNHNQGIAPSNLKKLTIKNGNGLLKVAFTPPDDTVVQEQLLCTVKGVRILYKEGVAAVLNEEDGIVVADLEGEEMKAYASSGYVIEGLTNKNYYTVAVMPYSDQNVFNRNVANQYTGRPTDTMIYGFHQNFSDKNPETTITYRDENETFAPMQLNTNGTMNMGSWDDFPLIAECKPYMVHKDGTADYQLNETDYTKKLDGTASDVANTSYNGGAFSWLKRIYMKETYTADGNSRDVQFSFTNADESTKDFQPIGFVRGGEELEGIWIPMFPMDANGRTISGVHPIYNQTAAGERTIIQNWSANAVHLGGGIMNVIRDLLMLFSRSTDAQTHFGQGCMSAYVDSSPYYGVKVNAAVGGGMFYGTTGGTTLNKIFHSILLGSYQQLLRDPQTLLSGGHLLVSKDYDVYSLTGVGYTDTGKTFISSSAWRFPSKLQYVDGFGSVPVDDNGGTSGTGLCDGVYFNASGVRVARRLGYCADGLIDGPGCLYLGDEASAANWACGVGELLLPSVGYAPAT